MQDDSASPRQPAKTSLSRVKRLLRRLARRSLHRSGRSPAPLPRVQRRFESVVGFEQFRNPDRRVVVLADPSQGSEVREWITCFLPASVLVMSAAARPEWEIGDDIPRFREASTELSWHFKMIGPADVVVDLLPGSIDEHRKRWELLFFHLKPGGCYVIDASLAGLETFSSDGAAWASELIGLADSEAGRNSRYLQEVSRAIAAVNVSRDLLVVEKQGKHYLKLRDHQTNRMLPSREPNISVRELAELPPGRLESRARVTSHEAAVPIRNLESSMEYPPLHLRHYQGRLALVSNSLLHSEYTILPDSFRHHLEDNMNNPRIANVSHSWARIPPNLRPTRSLSGTYYLLDSENSGHFGHLMTEVMSRLWGWDAAKAAFPELKAIFRIRYPNERDPALERRIFRAYGIAEEDIVVADEPVFLDSVVAATPMWHNQVPHYVHPQIRDVWERVGAALVDPGAPEYDKIFVSRTSEMARRCRNAPAVEELFRRHGFEVIYPERFDLSIQAGIFAKARVIAGLAGSAMFNMLFARNLSTVIVLAQEHYTARNEHLYTAVLGGDVHYFWSSPDLDNTGIGPDGKPRRPYYADWDFDFDRNEAELTKLLGTL